MARTITTIGIEGQPALALFDTGALYTYVRSALIRVKHPRGCLKRGAGDNPGGATPRGCPLSGQAQGPAPTGVMFGEGDRCAPGG
jgi:hypothetical protein